MNFSIDQLFKVETFPLYTTFLTFLFIDFFFPFKWGLHLSLLQLNLTPWTDFASLLFLISHFGKYPEEWNRLKNFFKKKVAKLGYWEDGEKCASLGGFFRASSDPSFIFWVFLNFLICLACKSWGVLRIPPSLCYVEQPSKGCVVSIKSVKFMFSGREQVSNYEKFASSSWFSLSHFCQRQKEINFFFPFVWYFDWLNMFFFWGGWKRCFV